MFSRSVSGHAGTERPFAFSPPPGIKLYRLGKKLAASHFHRFAKLNEKESEAKAVNIGLDHGYYAIKTRHHSSSDTQLYHRITAAGQMSNGKDKGYFIAGKGRWFVEAKVPGSV